MKKLCLTDLDVLARRRNKKEIRAKLNVESDIEFDSQIWFCMTPNSTWGNLIILAVFKKGKDVTDINETNLIFLWK